MKGAARRCVPPCAALVALLVAACVAAEESPSATRSSVASDSAAPTVRAPSATASSASATAAPEASTPQAVTPVWTELEVTGEAPPARENHTWTLDPGGEVAYLFGGRDGGTVYDDLWAYDLRADAWTRVVPDGSTPPARFGHSAAWVPDIGVVVFAGQAAPELFYNDLWAFDPTANAWRQLPGGGAAPLARYGSCAALDADGRLWISHGFTQEGNRYADTRTYDFAAAQWTDVTPSGDVPVARCLHGCFWSIGDDRLVLYAGQTTGVTALGDLWTLDPQAGWTEHDPPPTAARNLYAFARRTDDILVFGGADDVGGFPTDTFTLGPDLEFAALETISAPPGRRAAQMIDDTTGGRTLLFAGASDSGALADLWELRTP